MIEFILMSIALLVVVMWLITPTLLRKKQPDIDTINRKVMFPDQMNILYGIIWLIPEPEVGSGK